MMRATRIFFAAGFAALLSALVPIQVLAQDNIWRVGKVSGEAWIAGSGVQQISLGQASMLKPGDTIRTGRNGRVLLIRGAETMLISANSQVSVPTTTGLGRSTILQQAGSVLLDVEKRNVQHFEVETPFLAAVVKGTQFRVTVTSGSARVDVRRGQVQVSDFRSGEFVLVRPGQAASAAASGAAGLRLSGSGQFNPTQHGAPRPPSIRPISVPRDGLPPPTGAVREERRAGSGERSGRTVSVGGGTVRIGSALGEINVDAKAVTRGLARNSGGQGAVAGRERGTIWSTGELSPAGGIETNVRRNGNVDAGKSSGAETLANINGQANAQAYGLAGRGAAWGNGGSNNGQGNAWGNGGGNNGRGNAWGLSWRQQWLRQWRQ